MNDEPKQATEVANSNTENSSAGFEWIELYKGIAKKIYEKSTSSDIEGKKKIVKNVFETISSVPDFVKDRFNPFSLFAAFNYNSEKRLGVLKTVSKELKCNDNLVPKPTGFMGIPHISPRTNPFDSKDDKYVVFLWNLFETAITYADDNNETNKANFVNAYNERLQYITPSFTMVLFQMRPDVFLPLDSNTRNYLVDNDFKVKNWEKSDKSTQYITLRSILRGKIPPAAQYLDLINEVKNWIKKQPNALGFSSVPDDNEIFAQLSYKAWASTSFSQVFELLNSHHQVILTGAPGTGKTYTAMTVAAAFVDESLDEQLFGSGEFLADDVKEIVLNNVFSKPEKYFPDLKELGSKPEEFKQAVFTDFVQFHPGYDYSDFVIGMKPVLLSEAGQELEMKNGDYVLAGTETKVSNIGKAQVSFRWKDGIFKKFAKRAQDAYDNATGKKKAPRFVFLIDEINRADLSRVFGELFSLLEEEYRYPNNPKGITLANGENFVIPENLYIIATMNDIDKSVESMDFALRRRFAWYEVTAKSSEIILDKWAEEENVDPEIVGKLKNAMEALNKEIAENKELKLGAEYQIGGAYFKTLGKGEEKVSDTKKAREKLWDNHLKVILSEYLRGNLRKEDQLKGLHKAYEDGWNKKDDGEPQKGQG